MANSVFHKLSHVFKKNSLWLSILLVIITLVIDEAIFSDQRRRVDPKSQITANVAEQLSRVNNQINDISEVLIVDLNRLFNRLEENEELPYFIYQEGELLYWSTNRFVPKYGTLTGTYLYKFLELKSGQFIVQRKVINNAENRVIEIFVLLPLRFDNGSEVFEKFGINGEIFGRSSFQLSDTESRERGIYSPEGIFLFSFDGLERMKIEYPSYAIFIFILYVIAISLFLIAGSGLSTRLLKNEKYFLSILVWTSFLFLVRFTMLRYEYPSSVIEWKLFAPDTFASSWWSPSLGDFLLNQICLLSIVWRGYQAFGQRLARNFSRFQVLFTITLFLLANAYFIIQLESLLKNAQWSLDISKSIDFDIEKLAAYLCIFLIGIIPFLTGQLFCEIINRTKSSLIFKIVFAAVAMMALTLKWVVGVAYMDFLAIASIYILVIFGFNLYKNLYKVNYSTFLYLFTTAFYISILSEFTLQRHIDEEVRLDKLSLVTELQSSEDITAEYLLSEAIDGIRNDVLIQTSITNPFAPKEQLKTTIRRVYLGDYFDKYDIQIELFNGSGGAFNNNIRDWSFWKDSFQKEENQTDFEGLFFFKDQSLGGKSTYYGFIEIKRYNTIVGYILLLLEKKPQLNNSILPKLILDDLSLTADLEDFDYAIYRGGTLSLTEGEFNYERDFSEAFLSNDLLFSIGLEIQGHLHLAFRGGQDQEVFVVSNALYPLRYKVTNFAIFFLFMVALIILVFGVNGLYFAAKKTNTTLSAKVQLLLNFSFFLPLIIVSLVVLSLVNNTVEESIESQYLGVSESAGNNILSDFEDFLTSRSENNADIEERITEIGQYAQADINLYNSSGRLVSTNQRIIFENELLSEYINPSAVRQISEAGSSSVLNIESVGDLEYKVAYYGIKSSENELLGIISMPFFDSEKQLKDEQREILSNILNAFTLIFVAFIILSFLASRILTYPFKYLTERIKKTTISNLSEPIIWNADDEIGLMVNEYNKMLIKLEKNKKALALSEKESAWREMAQQVAHEIKNPLTPMKLKLQHLKRVLADAPDLDNSYNKSIDNLLIQVDTLSDIATSFSSFAKMPIPKSERVNLVSTIKKAIGLFNETEVEIKTNIPRAPIWIVSDEKLLSRIFNNLILNAQQAKVDGRAIKLEIEVEIGYNKVSIHFQDNGIGIPDELKDKIFIPKFSTKEKGSGIGLAIAKRGVEHAGGSIWFESEEGVGTTFFIEFPLTD